MYSASACLRLRAQRVVERSEHLLADRLEIGVGVIGKFDVVGDARAEARIGMEETVHLVGVAGENNHEIVAIVLHHLQQNLDRLLPVVALVLLPIEIVGLVDEQYAAHRLFQHLFRFRRGVADILADEIVTRHRDEVAAPHIAEPVKNLRHPDGHRRLAGAGIAGEAHVQGRRLRGETEFRPHAIDQQQSRDLADALLDGGEADQLVVELLQHRADTRLRELLGEIDLRRRCRLGLALLAHA